MNGILLIDKPLGITSHGVVSKIRKKLGIKKIGHAGTLDPSATGLLIICVGHATKISSYLMGSDKIYETGICFGKTTTTYDTEGEIVAEKDTAGLQVKNIEICLSKLTGEQMQKPPMYSAVKVAGKKLYQYARANTEIEIQPRRVFVESIKMELFSNPTAKLRIACSKGTYVRSLVHDLGQMLAVGASVSLIRRLQSGSFSVDQATSLESFLEMEPDQITKQFISVSDALTSGFHPIRVSKDEEARIIRGIEYPKHGIQDQDFNPDSLFLFVSQETKTEIAIGRWGVKDRIEIKRVF